MNFEMTEEQFAKAKDWMKKRHRYAGAVGGQFSFVFTPTSLGMIVVVKDSEGELDLTDITNW